MSKALIIQTLGLSPHIEGGYFKRTFESESLMGNHKRAMSSIYYLLTDDSSTGFLHQNQSDIIHFFHSGSPIEYTLISPEGVISTHILGPDLSKGHQFQLVVKGGYWKASQLLEGSFGLISESVCPGFEYADMIIASRAQMQQSYPTLIDRIEHLIKPTTV
ncbi:cupin domain-containing protein [Alkalimarinus sediminis]|uniref:Cupin domain-containing protein n=1 Tax=Alkalimarinus sediminis TaxID=1632866 RepID=A0A9E8HG09_9ALTE|nr:cupin domain-containing protein [Alkalimarinus sediminis]UZW73965.1 cupin domain-containing protein [Alkalimarinus sediminis]